MKQGHLGFKKDNGKFTEPERKIVPQVCRNPLLPPSIQMANPTPARKYYVE